MSLPQMPAEMKLQYHRSTSYTLTTIDDMLCYWLKRHTGTNDLEALQSSFERDCKQCATCAYHICCWNYTLWGACDQNVVYVYKVWDIYYASYSISQEICTRFCCVLLCCGYAIVHNEFTWSIYPYSSGLLCWHWAIVRLPQCQWS